jgi:hypothetical protein
VSREQLIDQSNNRIVAAAGGGDHFEARSPISIRSCAGPTLDDHDDPPMLVLFRPAADVFDEAPGCAGAIFPPAVGPRTQNIRGINDENRCRLHQSSLAACAGRPPSASRRPMPARTMLTWLRARVMDRFPLIERRDEFLAAVTDHR